MPKLRTVPTLLSLVGASTLVLLNGCLGDDGDGGGTSSAADGGGTGEAAGADGNGREFACNACGFANPPPPVCRCTVFCCAKDGSGDCEVRLEGASDTLETLPCSGGGDSAECRAVAATGGTRCDELNAGAAPDASQE